MELNTLASMLNKPAHAQRVTWFALFSLFSCSSDSTNTTKPSGAGSVKTGKEFASLLVDAACKNLLECRFSQDDASGLRAWLGGMDDCRAFFGRIVGDGESTIFGIDVRGYAYQSGKADACLAKFPKQCAFIEVEEPGDAFTGACAEVYEGSVAGDDVCERDLDCAGDAYCGNGACRLRTVEGQSCVGAEECKVGDADGAVCLRTEPSSELGTCKPGTVARVGEGEACGFSASSMEQVAVCEPALVCVPSSDEGEAARCRKPVPEGGDCSLNRECEPNSTCLGNKCVAFVRRAEGQACSRSSTPPADGSPLGLCWSPTADLDCDATSRCVKEASGQP